MMSRAVPLLVRFGGSGYTRLRASRKVVGSLGATPWRGSARLANAFHGGFFYECPSPVHLQH